MPFKFPPRKPAVVRVPPPSGARPVVIPPPPPGPVPPATEASRAGGVRVHHVQVSPGQRVTYPCGLARWILIHTGAMQFAVVPTVYNRFRLDEGEWIPCGVLGFFLKPGGVFRSFDFEVDADALAQAVNLYVLTGDSPDGIAWRGYP